MQPISLVPLRRKNPPGKALYRIDTVDGSAWVLRAYHPDYLTTAPFSWLSRYPLLSTWLESQAHLLVYLAEQGYSVPYVCSPRSHDLLGICQEWLFLLTNFVAGDPYSASVEKMRALGGSLGSLHMVSLPPEEISPGSIRISWWEPDTAISYALHQLAPQAELIPIEWQEAYQAFLHTFHYFLQHPSLARTIIHGDCWAENGIQVGEDEAILIDWECAGLGLAIIDLGALLLHCHFDQMDNHEYTLDTRRIAAVLDGYCQRRQIPPQELEVLLEAVRFSISWRGLWMLSQTIQKQWNEEWKPRLRRWWRWYLLSAEIAGFAQKYITTIQAEL